MSRILYVATSDIHIRAFHVPYLESLAEEGHTVDIAAERRGGLSFSCVNHAYWLPFPRTLASFQNLRSLRRLRKIIDSADYDLIHCHTPIPSLIARIAARKWRRRGGCLLYTVHGFHFYRRGPLRNWYIYYPAEWLLSSLTDAIITINHEDFGYVNGKMMHRRSFLIPGIGVDTKRFRPIKEEEFTSRRAALGFSGDDFVLLYIAEFSPGKDHLFLIDSVSELLQYIPRVRVVLAGKGPMLEQAKLEVVRRGLSPYFRFLGFRPDVERYAAIANVGVSTSRREGLGMGLLEQMACGVPVVASENRGHREFVKDGQNGFLYPQGNRDMFVRLILEMFHNADLRKRMGKAARRKAEKFSVNESLRKMKEIYGGFLAGKSGQIGLSGS